MRKLFLFVFLLSVAVVLFFALKPDAIRTDIYELLQVKVAQKDALNLVQSKFAKKITFVSTSPEILNAVKASKAFVFREFETDLGALKLATLNRQTSREILKNATAFVEKSAAELSNPLIFRPLSPALDLLNLASHSALFEAKLQVDFESGFLKNEKYYILFGEVAPKAPLLDEVAKFRQMANLQNAEFYVTSGAIFAALGKQSGEFESGVFGGVSFLLVCLLLVVAFKNVRIFWLMAVVIFSLVCGVAVSFLVLGSLHILTLVVASSLVGLVLDFAMHFLSTKMHGEKNGENSQKTKFARVVLCGFCITSLGYALFFFSGMKFLHEIAVLSISTLASAATATFFLFPRLVSEVKFESCRFFVSFLEKVRLCSRLALPLAVVLAVISGVVLWRGVELKDDIRDYSALDTALLKEAGKVAQVAGESGSTFVFSAPDAAAQKDAVEVEFSRLDGHVYNGLSRFFLGLGEQRAVVAALEKADFGAFEVLGLEAKQARKMVLSNLQASQIWQSQKSVLWGDFVLPDGRVVAVASDAKGEIKGGVSVSNLLSGGFTEVKFRAFLLKVCGFVVAFFVLWAFFGVRLAVLVVLNALFATFASLFLLAFLGVKLNIFAIFGLIIGSVVAIDYMLFAHSGSSLKEKIFAIVLANLTSVFSFGLLFFSKTAAISCFGVSASLSMLFAAFGAVVYAVRGTR